MSQIKPFKPPEQRAGKPVKDKVHMARLALLPCCVCGHRPVDVHHLYGAPGRGMSRKADDRYTVPLCKTHHDQCHLKDGARSFERKHGLWQEADYLWSISQETQKAPDSD